MSFLFADSASVIASGPKTWSGVSIGIDGFEDLCERIRADCAARGWYGPDATRYWGRLTRTAECDFLFATATEDQVRTTEDALGFALPAALRAVYLRVANGGFGPGYGLVGTSGGAPSDDVWTDYWLKPARPPVSIEDAQDDDVLASPDDSVLRSHLSDEQHRRAQDPTLAATLARTDWHLSERAAHALATEPGLHLECEDYPDRFLTLCHWGCSVYSKLDGWTGRIFGAGKSQASDWQQEGEAPWVRILEYQASSTEEWFELWLSGKLYQPFAHKTLEDIERERESLIRPLYLDLVDDD